MFRSTSSPQGPPRPRWGLVLFGRLLRGTALAGIAFAVSLSSGAGAALAYWPASGTGSTTAAVATLIPPTGVSALAMASNVSVSWTASAGAVAPTGYYVTRITGSTSAFACGSSPAAPLTTTACTDASVPVGAHSYVVTAVHRSWSAASPASNSVTIASLIELAFLSQPPATVTAGSTVAGLRVQLQTPGAGLLQPAPLRTPGVQVRLGLGSHPAGGALTGELTATTDAFGVATFGGVIIEKAGIGYTLTASSAGYSGAVSTNFSVTAGPATQLVVASPASLTGVASSTASVGPILVERRDAWGNPAVGEKATVMLSEVTGSLSVPGFFAATAGGENIVSVAIQAGSTSTAFYYRNTKTGWTTLKPSIPGLAVPDGISVEVKAGAPNKLKLTIANLPVLKNEPFSATVSIADAFDNQTQSTALVSLTSTGVQKCRINGAPVTLAAGNGLVSFDNLSHNGKQTGCEFTAASDGLPPVHLVFDVV